MDYTIVIPARYASTRLPAKPLQDIVGKPMIQRVYEQACKANAQRVVVATDHAEIESVCRGFGAEVILTSVHHPTGTDRIQEVAVKLGLRDDEVVVNVQGDEPLLPPSLIEQVAQLLAQNPAAAIATLCEPIEDETLVFNPNVVKVVTTQEGKALYFSRATIPWSRDGFNQTPKQIPAAYFRHIGMYAYRVGFLHQYVNWSPCPLEQIEALEQLRALYYGAVIQVAQATEIPPGGVDTPEDLERVRHYFA